MGQIPTPPDDRRCQGVNREGRPCSNWSLVGGTLCPAHAGKVGGDTSDPTGEARRPKTAEEQAMSLATGTLRRVARTGSDAAAVAAARELLQLSGRHLGAKPKTVEAIRALSTLELEALLRDLEADDRTRSLTSL